MNASNPQVSTHFAPAGRDSAGEIRRKNEVIETAPLLQQTIDAMPDLVLILNGNRQVISANRPVLETLACDLQDVLGKRPGELVRCQNATIGPDGCGTAKDCMTCGAVNAILECQQSDQKVTLECRICLEEPIGGALDLKAAATVVDVQGELVFDHHVLGQLVQGRHRDAVGVGLPGVVRGRRLDGDGSPDRAAVGGLGNGDGRRIAGRAPFRVAPAGLVGAGETRDAGSRRGRPAEHRPVFRGA